MLCCRCQFPASVYGLVLLLLALNFRLIRLE